MDDLKRFNAQGNGEDVDTICSLNVSDLLSYAEDSHGDTLVNRLMNISSEDYMISDSGVITYGAQK